MYSELAGCSATPQLASPQPEVFSPASPALVSTGRSREPSQPPGFSTPAGGVENHNHLQLLHCHCLIRQAASMLSPTQLAVASTLSPAAPPCAATLPPPTAAAPPPAPVSGGSTLPSGPVFYQVYTAIDRQSSRPRVFTYARFSTTASPAVGLLNC